MEEYIRDYTMAAAILGLFSFVWFGWAQERPRKSWRVYLGIGSTLGIIVSAAGIYLSITHWNGASILHEQSNFTYYIIFVAIEFTVAAVISAVLLIKKHSDYVAPWIAFVVGVHFFPLSFVFDDFTYNILGGLITVVSLISLPLSKRLDVANSAVTGIGTGVSLFLFALFNLIRALMI